MSTTTTPIAAEDLWRMPANGRRRELVRGSWEEPPVFGWLRSATGASEDDLLGTFNLGIGMVLVVAPEHVERVLGGADGARRVGSVVTGAPFRIT